MEVEPPESFVLRHLPVPGSGVLEVGCGQRGDLAWALDAAGHRVVAIDPQAPDGPIFRRVALEEFDDDPFDAIVASRSLHHVHDLDDGLDRITRLLRPDGVIVVIEHAFDLVDERTARWFVSRTTDPTIPTAPEEFLPWWEDHHEGLHGYATLRPELERRFETEFFDWGPYLHHSLEEVDAAEEVRLIEAGEVEATGFRFVGAKREDSTVRR